MHKRMHRDGLATGLMALALSTPFAALAADEPSEQWRLDEELGEILVEAERARPKAHSWKEYQEPFNWLARMVGTFVIDGNVDLRAQGNEEDLRKVSGRAECVGFGVAPGVQCELKIRWPETSGPDGKAIPGGVSSLTHAVMLFGSELPDPNSRSIQINLPGRTQADQAPATPGVAWILVDNRGVADNAVGRMVSADTMQSRSRCLDIPGDCERVVRITAWPDMRLVEFRIELVIDARKAVNFTFVMHRVPGTESVVYGRKK